MLRLCMVTVLLLESVCLAFGFYAVDNGATNNSIVDQLIVESIPRSFEIDGDYFMLNGKKFRYVAGSLHYFRTPHQYWRPLLRKLRAAGLNAVSTYVEWSFHEPEEREYDWSGDRNLTHFIELAAQESLLVLLRPGPYICAERDLGGLPYWLLSKYPNIQLRTVDEDFISEVRIWYKTLFEKISPLLYGNGGPIILVQVENEYGSFGCDINYMKTLQNITQAHVGDAALLYTTDGVSSEMVKCGSVPGALTTIDYGTGTSPRDAFKFLRSVVRSGPLVNSEFYPGWLTHWGERFQRVDSDDVVSTLNQMLALNASVNFYVFFGGTNFEHTAGANFDGVYQPDITSYDYDAPITEYGNITKKYLAIKAALEKYRPFTKELKTEQVKTASYGVVNVTAQLELLSEEGRQKLGRNGSTVIGNTLPTFESRRQRGGLMLYEIVLCNGEDVEVLNIPKPRDRVYVYIDGDFEGIIKRTSNNKSIPISARNSSVLTLLVENQGRINFGSELKDFKGILGNVYVNNDALNGTWKVLGYPIQELNSVPHRSSHIDVRSPKRLNGPVVYSGEFTLQEEQKPQVTFLNTKGWGKGWAWINGHNLGRYWPSKRPQVTLYVPGVYLRPYPEKNLVQLLELESAASTVEFIDHPIFI